MDDMQFEIKCRQYLIKRLSVLEKDIEKTVEKEKAKRAKEKAKRANRVARLTAYEDSDQAQEAYAYGDISQEEFEEICGVLEENAKFIMLTRTPKVAALEMLKEFMYRMKSDIKSFEWEMKSPEERERILKEQEEFRRKHGLS